ncbi:hypothetical protein BaRGS_00040583 [Batillaria attramentaria]|uniref:Uncharacterized protein n=1 Tax=Batillaria attramentaria TaxID=370345 RepID=A0ABD0IYW0_9CAEN
MTRQCPSDIRSVDRRGTRNLKMDEGRNQPSLDSAKPGSWKLTNCLVCRVSGLGTARDKGCVCGSRG